MLRSPSPRLFAAVFAALLAATPQLADAQWKWKDPTGRVQYSDLPPPPGTPEGDILLRPVARTSVAPRTSTAPLAAASGASAPATAASGLVPKSNDPELEARRKKAEAEQAAKQKADQDRVAAAKAENCKRAQEGMRTFDSGVRIARTNEKGEREILDDSQRASETKRIKEAIASDCK